METPLDVLSHAAAMVQTDEANREAALRSTETSRSESPKDLPSKINRIRRSTERRELSQALKFDENHIASKPTTTTTRCAGTQTVLSTVKELSDNSYLPNMTTLLDPENRIDSSVANNNHLSVTVTTNSQQMRPSVIACAPPPQSRENGLQLSAVQDKNELNTASNGSYRREVTCPSGLCDPAIDEHFRRSLGKDYKEEYWSSKPSNAIRITGTVDEHFAQALGKTWSEIQSSDLKEDDSQSPATKPNNNHINIQRSTMVSI
ncbi:transcription cofactor vestigial-like protein 4 [Saccoglossus kowalevskii]|uniref:Transcription cofactor vestigial-like protein 4-like n=1 Tax=Saccoglossus kowalevskii TaxID=10224 RepID=A0ABM0MLR2_SACKO|nr:PREDICTED: transcription cofactor vestigial-like protein 4-like [Saccoglossus kowalevskii]